MNFIRRIGRDEIYIKYVHQLVNVSVGLHWLAQMTIHITALRCISSLKITSKLPLH